MEIHSTASIGGAPVLPRNSAGAPGYRPQRSATTCSGVQWLSRNGPVPSASFSPKASGSRAQCLVEDRGVRAPEQRWKVRAWVVEPEMERFLIFHSDGVDRIPVPALPILIESPAQSMHRRRDA